MVECQDYQPSNLDSPVRHRPASIGAEFCDDFSLGDRPVGGAPDTIDPVVEGPAIVRLDLDQRLEASREGMTLHR
jgi:hypothetical protein